MVRSKGNLDGDRPLCHLRLPLYQAQEFGVIQKNKTHVYPAAGNLANLLPSGAQIDHYQAPTAIDNKMKTLHKDLTLRGLWSREGGDGGE